MPPAVQCQVIRPREAAIAVRALERLHSRVLAVMPRQFVGTRKLPGAAFPGTLVGLLTCKKSRHTSSGAASLSCSPPSQYPGLGNLPSQGNFGLGSLRKIYHFIGTFGVRLERGFLISSFLLGHLASQLTHLRAGHCVAKNIKVTDCLWA